MNRTVIIVAAFLLSAGTVFAQPGTLYRGRLEPEALPTLMYGGVRFPRIKSDAVPATPEAFRGGSSVYEGEVEWAAAGRDGNVKVLVSESKSGERFACADLNGDGNYVATECKFFTPGQQEDSADPEVRFFVPTRVGPFKRLPLVITYPPSAASKESDGDQIEIHYTGAVYARGSVDIAGQKTLITFSVRLGSGGRVDPRNGQVGIDGNGNGQLDGYAAALESALAEEEDLVFKVGQRYVTVQSVSAENGEVVLRECSAADYLFIDRAIGAPIPDFVFADFGGKERRLSDYRGKFVLLDFWGTWCGPCIREFPFLKAAYEKLRERGLEIIGIDFEPDSDPAVALDKARKLVESRGIAWTQATAASTEYLTKKRFRVRQFPTTLLISPDGKLLSTGADHTLTGDNLLPTLESFMFRK